MEDPAAGQTGPRAQGLFQRPVSASGRMIFTAGIVGWDEHESFPEYTLHGQFARAPLRNTLQVLAEDGAGPAACRQDDLLRPPTATNIWSRATRSAPPGARSWAQLSGRMALGRGQGPGRKRGQGRDRGRLRWWRSDGSAASILPGICRGRGDQRSWWRGSSAALTEPLHRLRRSPSPRNRGEDEWSTTPSFVIAFPRWELLPEFRFRTCPSCTIPNSSERRGGSC